MALLRKKASPVQVNAEAAGAVERDSNADCNLQGSSKHWRTCADLIRDVLIETQFRCHGKEAVLQGLAVIDASRIYYNNVELCWNHKPLHKSSVP